METDIIQLKIQTKNSLNYLIAIMLHFNVIFSFFYYLILTLRSHFNHISFLFYLNEQRSSDFTHIVAKLHIYCMRIRKPCARALWCARSWRVSWCWWHLLCYSDGRFTDLQISNLQKQKSHLMGSILFSAPRTPRMDRWNWLLGTLDPCHRKKICPFLYSSKQITKTLCRRSFQL